MSQEISKNRKAYHDFNIVDKFEEQELSLEVPRSNLFVMVMCI